MILIQEILVSEEVVNKNFACDLSQCKGACCWEGDLGAPLDEEEIPLMEKAMKHVMPLLDAESNAIIREVGVFDREGEEYLTPLKKDESCVFLVGNKGQGARCGFEIAYERGEIDFWKPISCHLYPIRIHKNRRITFESLNYDEWDICRHAVRRGEEQKIELVHFVKDALIRKYGVDFYDELLEAMVHYRSEEENDNE